MQDRKKLSTRERLKQERDNTHDQFTKRREAEREVFLTQGKLNKVTVYLRDYLNKLATAGNDSALSLFFDTFEDLSFHDEKLRYGYTALMHAAEAGHLSTCELLISRLGKERLSMGAGFNADEKSIVEINALDVAATKGHLEICQLLVSHGIQATHSHFFRGALSLAVEQNHSSVVRYLLKPNVRTAIGLTQDDLDSALPEAVNYELVTMLIEAGAHINSLDGAGGSALEAAICRADKETMRYLLEHSAKLDSLNFTFLLYEQAYQGLTFLMEMVNAEQKEHIFALCESNYHEVEESEENDQTQIADPQSKACFASFFNQHKSVVKAQGADHTMENDMGSLPIFQPK